MEVINSLCESLGTTPGTVAVGLVLLVVCALIIRAEIKNHKNGGSCSGCAGGCKTGASCPSCSIDVDALERAVEKAEQESSQAVANERHGNACEAELSQSVANGNGRGVR